jgi:hypothetical protein
MVGSRLLDVAAPLAACLAEGMSRSVPRRWRACVTRTRSRMSLPDVVTREEWLAARKELLAREKEFTRQRDALNAERRLRYESERADACGRGCGTWALIGCS